MSQTLEQKAVELIDQVQGLAKPAMQITLQALRVSAIIDMVTAAVVLVAVIVLARSILPKWWKDLQESRFETEMSRGARFFGTAIVASIFGVISLCTLLSTCNWLAIISPELALARILIAKVS